MASDTYTPRNPSHIGVEGDYFIGESTTENVTYFADYENEAQLWQGSDY